MANYTITTSSTTAQSLNQGTGDTLTIGSPTNKTASLIVSSGVAVPVSLSTMPANGGVAITNYGTLQSNNGRTIDTGSTTAVSGSQIAITNAGMIVNSGGASGNDDAIRVGQDITSGTFLLYNTGSIVTYGAVNDSVAVRLGKVYTASTITIDNGIDANGNINTSATISTADADAIRPGGVDPSNSATAFGSSVVNNYGKILASYQTGAGSAQLSKDNGIDIGAGQSSTVNNFGTIVGDESGLGIDNTAGGAGFVANYNVTNSSGATITGNNGAGIAAGTATITNLGTIAGKALGAGSTKVGGVAPTVSVGNGTGIYSTGLATIVNGSTTNATAIIQGSGAIGNSSQGGTTYYGININNGSVTNYGVITETTATNAGAAVNISGSAASTVTNYGTITGANGLAITMGSGNDTVNLYTGESVTGKIDGGAGTNTLTLNLGPSATTGTLANTTNFQLLSVLGGTWTINDTESYANGITAASGATLSLGQAAALTGGVTDNGTLNFADTGSYAFANTIGGTGVVTQAGAGTLSLSGANTYSGDTNLNAGTLDIVAAGAAGTGAITFASGTETLAVEQAALTQSGSAYSFGNTVAGFNGTSTIDLRGTGTETGATFNTSTNVLTVSGAETISLQLDASAAPAAGYAYGVTSDGVTAANGAQGANVALDRIATVTGITTNPSGGYATANQTIAISIALSKAVTVSGNGPTLTLSDGGTATYDATNSTSTTLVFDTTVVAGQNAAGVQITSIANGGSAQDSAQVPVDFSKAINQTPVGPAIDASTPNVTIATTGSLTNQASQTITGTVDTTADPETVGTTVNVIDGNTTIGSGTVASNGSWTANVTLSGNGQHTLIASDTDKAGNVGTSNSITYTLDTNTPTVTISSAGGVTNQTTQAISGTVDTSADPQTANTTVSVLDGGNVIGTATVGSNGAWSTNVTLSGEGQHVLTASDTDSAGNTGTSNAVTYTLDTQTPKVSITSAAGLTNKASQTLTGTVDTTADPQTAGTIVTVYEGTSALGTAKVGSNGSWSVNVTLSGDGQHTLTASDTDNAGNTGTSGSVTYTLDTQTPNVAISNVSRVTNTATQTISGTVDTTADPQTAGTTVNVFDGSMVIGTATVAANGAWSSSVTLSGDGQHVLTASDTDKAGNTGTSNSVTYTLDTQTPSVAITSAGDATNQASQTITGTVNVSADPQTIGTTVTVYEGSTALGTGTVASNGSWAANITLAGEGQHVLTASDTDKAGNIGTSGSVTYTLDTTPPDVDIVTTSSTVAQAVETISGTVDIADAGTTVTVYEGTTALGTALVGTNGAWGTSVTLQTQGTNTLTAQDTDAAGNVGTSDPISLDYEPTTAAFVKGNLVLSISGDSDGSGDYTDNQATPVALEQVTTSGTIVSTTILPQATVVVNGVTEYMFSGEYGSSSEGSLQLSADGKSLVIAGYDVNAQVYNTGGASVYGNAALAQSTSLTNQSTYTPVGRVIADISSTGVVDTSTVLYNVYNTNNPRSVATINGSSFYISGQGVSGDKTQGLYLVQDGSSSATAIYQGTDTRTAEIYNGVLYVSTDSKQPKNGGGTANIASYGGLPTSATTPTILKGISQSVILTAAQANTVNGSAVGTSVNLDPENFFFANSTTLYVADGGIPKQGGVGDGGLQKWSYNGTQWVLDYTLSQGLNIVQPGANEGTTGLIGLTGKVVGNTVELYATNQTVGDLDQKYLFGISDALNATSGAGESFTTLVTAAPDTNIRGVSFAPSTAAPTVTISSQGGLTNQPTQSVTGTVDVADAGTTVSVLQGTTVLGTALVGVDGSWTASVTLSGDGAHTLTASDTDAYGNTGTSGSITYTLDTQIPNVAITNPGGVTNQAAQTISGTVDTTADPQTAGTTVSVLDNGSLVGTATVASNGSWSTSVTLTGDGQHVLTASDTDNAGNTGTSGSVTYTLDTQTPDVAISSPAGLTNKAGQTVTGTVDTTADPQTAGTTVTVYEGTTALATATVGNDGSWSANVLLSGDGQHVLTASDTDKAGNTGTSGSVTYTLDTATPDVTISNTGGITNSATQTISGTVDTTADPQTSGTTVSVFDGSTVVGTTTVGMNGTWSVGVTLSGDGQHVLTASDTDNAGNTGTSNAVTYTLDTQTPMVAITSTAGLTNSPSQTVTGTVDTTADPQTAGTTITVYDGTTVLATTKVGSGGTWSANVTLSGDGQHVLTASDTDNAGNTGTSGSVTYTLDTATPDVTIANTGSTTNQATQTISGTVDTTADPQTSGTTVSVFDGSVVVGSGTVGSNGAWSASVTLSGDGTHTLTASDTDNAGNTGTSNAVTYTLGTATPAVTISSPGGTTSQASQTVSGTVNTNADPQAIGSTVTIYDGTTALGTGRVASNGNWGVNVTLTGSGDHHLTASDTDGAGNVGTSASTLYTLVTSASNNAETVNNVSGGGTFSIGDTTLTVNETSATTYSGVIQDGSSGTGGSLVVAGPAPLTLTGVNTYTGKTSISGTLALAGAGSIQTSTKAALTTSGATLDISGENAGTVVQKLGGVAGSVADLGSKNLKIKVQTGITDTFAGTIADGGLSGGTGGSLELGGPGTLTLTAANSYTGATRLDAGTLVLSGSGTISTSSGLSLASAATFDTSAETTESIGTLSGVAGALVDLGAGMLTVNEGTATTFAGVIQNGGGSGGTGGGVAVGGTAALTLTSVNTYTGRTSISGNLDLAGAGSIQTSTKAALTTSGATLDISGTTSGTVINKLGGVAGSVTDLGGKNLKIKVQSGIVDTFGGTLQDGGVSGGTGGSVELGGLGELSLTGSNTYTGGTKIDAGTVDLAASGAAGTGTITFANTASNVATLEIDAAALTSTGSSTYNFANAIAGATSTSQVIDLRSLTYVQGSTTATLSGTTLAVNDGTSSVTLHLAAAQPKSSFTTASDGHGGTLVYDPPATSAAPTSTAKVDSHWIEMAMADFGGVAGDAHASNTPHDPYGLAASADLASHIGGAHRFG